ncbi:MAG TPA: hypothetical protein VHA78_06105, partial [Candidatus Peribacteraceae bacterium]|nr:hypothetical protein [Candidatus Peribacteraceae bacterium]
MKKLVIAIAILLILVVAASRWYVRALSPVDQSTVSTAVTIKKGTGTSQIADQLYKEQLIRSPLAFKIYMKTHGG